MAEDTKKAMKEDLQQIKYITSKMDFANTDAVKRLLSGINSKGILNSALGVKFKNKLTKISEGKNDCICLTCDAKTSGNLIFCDSCYAKVFAVKKEGTTNQKDSAKQGNDSKLEKVIEQPVEEQKKDDEEKKDSKVKKVKNKSRNKIIFICVLTFLLLAGIKEAFFSDTSAENDTTDAYYEAEVNINDTSNANNHTSTDKEVTTNSKDKDSSYKKEPIQLSFWTIVVIIIVLLVLSYFYVSHYEKEYTSATGTNCGGLLDYRWSIVQGISLLLAVVLRPQNGESAWGIIFFLICVAIVLVSEYVIYKEVLTNADNKALAKKAVIAQLSIAFLIGFAVAIVLLMVSLIMSAISENEKKIKNKDKDFLATALGSIAIFALMEELDKTLTK